MTQESEPSCSRKLITVFRRPNAALALVIIAVATMLSLTLLWPIATGLFRFGPLHVDDLIVTFGAGVLVLVLLEFMKLLWRK